MAPIGRIGQRSLLVLLGFAALFPRAAHGLQFASLSPSPAASSATAIAPVEMTGVVLNARTRQPIARALVRLGERGVLTNHDGVFDFPQVAVSSGTLVASKPGFFAGVDAGDMGGAVYQFGGGEPIVLTLYPEAILTGTVLDEAGEGLPNLNVVARRSTFDEMGHHWRPAGTARTKSDGSFRLTMMAGDYSVEIRALNQSRSGTDVLLPLSIPVESSSVKETLHLRPGEVSEIHAAMESRKGYEVAFAPAGGARRGFPRLIARGSNGLTIPLSPRPSRSDPDVMSVVLPSGTYAVSGTLEAGGGSEEASSSVTVPDHDIEGVELHLSKVPALPVEVDVDSGATSDNGALPTAQSLGLSLVSVATSGDAVEQTFQANPQRDLTASFSVPSGTYRLHARSGGGWIVSGATYGGVDLLNQDLVVSAGMGSAPVRIVASNQTASLSGTVTLAGQPAAGWVYLVSTTPSATPVVMVRAGASGSFSRAYMPPGSYRVIALERRIGVDFADPATMASFLDRAQSVTLSPGGQQTMTLSAVPVAELAP